MPLPRPSTPRAAFRDLAAFFSTSGKRNYALIALSIVMPLLMLAAVTVAVPQDVAEFQRMFQSDWFDAVGISVSTDRQLDTLAALLPQLRHTLSEQP